MRHSRFVTLSVGLSIAATACGLEPAAGGVAVPGAASEDVFVIPSNPSTSTTSVPATTSPIVTTSTTPTTAAPTTAVPTTAVPTTVVPTTTEPATTTTVAPTTTAAPVYVAEPSTGTLRAGVEGPRSLQLQRDLIELQFLPPGADDSQYGPGTAGGVRRFQESEGLVIDGVAGPNTLAALAQAIDDRLADV